MGGLHARLRAAAPCIYLIIVSYSALVIGQYIYILQKEGYCSIKKREKMIGHHTRLREDDDLPLWRAPTIKKKPPFCNVRAVITRDIMRTKDAQCNTKE